MTSYNFIGTSVSVSGTRVQTTTNSLGYTYKGSITLESYGTFKHLVLDPQSSVEITDTEIADCLADPDACYSGFSVSVAFR